jgi:hypothetical protein
VHPNKVETEEKKDTKLAKPSKDMVKSVTSKPLKVIKPTDNKSKTESKTEIKVSRTPANKEQTQKVDKSADKKNTSKNTKSSSTKNTPVITQPKDKDKDKKFDKSAVKGKETKDDKHKQVTSKSSNKIDASTHDSNITAKVLIETISDVKPHETPQDEANKPITTNEVTIVDTIENKEAKADNNTQDLTGESLENKENIINVEKPIEMSSSQAEPQSLEIDDEINNVDAKEIIQIEKKDDLIENDGELRNENTIAVSETHYTPIENVKTVDIDTKEEVSHNQEEANKSEVLFKEEPTIEVTNTEEPNKDVETNMEVPIKEEEPIIEEPNQLSNVSKNEGLIDLDTEPKITDNHQFQKEVSVEINEEQNIEPKTEIEQEHSFKTQPNSIEDKGENIDDIAKEEISKPVENIIEA